MKNPSFMYTALSPQAQKEHLPQNRKIPEWNRMARMKWALAVLWAWEDILREDAKCGVASDAVPL